MSSAAEFFRIVDAGAAHWAVLHEITDEPAGSIARTPRGYLLEAETTRLGTFATIDQALDALYEAV